MPKQATKKELLDLNAQLRAELSAVTLRDVEVYRVLGGRFGGETPVECAKRVVDERSTLAGKVVAKVAEAEGYRRQLETARMLEGVLKGKLASIGAIADSYTG